ncbi:hypothetical protein DCS_08174 [Drechmeria coniospora]|uniref:Uncharacterized protein n=1 Tax=Drechmeria coniospora TaxID=98403 RepID=A0A151GGL5_DRECN|nr:hypothetical protein DCS_08174 [Drechmeria coniospora]KYK56206.1 hypothetical protein DCS_08174 [Drechmeria coniospora]
MPLGAGADPVPAEDDQPNSSTMLAASIGYRAMLQRLRLAMPPQSQANDARSSMAVLPQPQPQRTAKPPLSMFSWARGTVRLAINHDGPEKQNNTISYGSPTGPGDHNSPVLAAALAVTAARAAMAPWAGIGSLVVTPAVTAVREVSAVTTFAANSMVPVYTASKQHRQPGQLCNPQWHEQSTRPG